MELLKIATLGLKFGTLALIAALFAPVPQAQAADCSDSAQAGVDWQDCRKRNLMLDGSDLSDSTLSGADFSSTDLRHTKLMNSNLSKSALARAMLDESHAPDSNFEKALGYRTSFVNADLSNANFLKSEMQRANFTGANLTNANFEKSELGRVNFSDADLNGTDFRYSNLARADFRTAIFDTPIDFTGTYLYLTRFEGVDLSKAIGIQQWQIDLACGDASTKLPSGTTAPDTWPCNPEDEF
ncbi:MAG: pentapeptide repeat-containing protein [Pseudomonadota bacterium]